MTIGELAEQYGALIESRSVLNIQLSEVTSKMEAISKTLLAQMEAEDLDKITAAGWTLYRKETITPHITDWEAVWCWAVKKGRFEFLWKQLKGAPYRECIENGDELPPGTEPVVVRALKYKKVG